MDRKPYLLYLLLAFAALLPASQLHAQYVLRQAQTQATLYHYPAAKTLYTKAYNKKHSLQAAKSLAEIYSEVKDYPNAEFWYARVVSIPGHSPADELHYAEALINNNKYTEARQLLQQYLTNNNGDQQATILLAGCDSAVLWLKQPIAGNLENMQALNTAYSDWGTMLYKGQLIFASDRPYDSLRRQPFFSNSTIKRKTYSLTGNSYLHLYQGNGTDSNNTRLLGRDINGDFHSANASFTANGLQMYYAVTNLEKKKSSFLGKELPYTLHIEIFSSSWDTARQRWTKKTAFPYNQVFHYSLGDPCISPDGQTIYFTATSGEGHLGGADIYYSKKDKAGKWSTPVNLGADINTRYNERTPFIDEEGQLYFASDGRAGMGGLDIYKAVALSPGRWTVTNMKTPVNSPQDDFAPYAENAQTFYFSSNRITGKGSDDIYLFSIKPNMLSVFNLEGNVRDEKTGLPIPGAEVTLLNQQNTLPAKVQTDNQGFYSFKLDSAANYELGANKTAYNAATGIAITTKGLTGSQTLRKDIVLSRPEPEPSKPVKLANIYFDLDKWTIRPDAARELDSLVTLLQRNADWIVEMSSHTDSRASDSYNMTLSQKRAEATMQYLVRHGIARARLTAKGYGETKLVNRCSNGVICSEAEHQQNRRTEFTVILR
ncbi:OmpA family protein [Deminuibacter soli]|uniref:Flagellar motor protein MotB n=1 Tax=Deminuibacter soli TaxID=2291815 RepID=A0A3E1NFW1_9BACT|nr:OmpA family protein [Deminuibacter soli]RFM26856.1 flagellar motor protein MotB [Deminuibacter soli]